jgi:hypothetical protein
MATDAELLQALQAAHEAGDEAGAIQIAQQLSSQPVSPVVENTNTSGSAHKAAAPPVADPSAGGSTLQVGPWDTGVHTSQGVDRFLSGAGQSMADTYRGVKQLLGGQTQADTDEQRKLDAPLDRTGAGLAGNIAGGIAQFALPGMGAEAAGAKVASRLATNPNALRAAQALYRVASPAATGAGFGATAPVGSDETRLGNTGRGAIAGELGGILGDAGASVLRTGEDALSRGARLGADIARKYNIPLSMSQTGGKFSQLLQSALDKFPGSGAEGRAATQKDAYNNALGQSMGVPDAGGALDYETWSQGRKAVGQAIGNMAQGHTALVTPAEITGVNNVLREVNSKATYDNAKIVNSYAKDMFGDPNIYPQSKTVPINNPMPGGPLYQIPGDAWRQQHTAISNHIARLGDDQGDLAYYLGQLKSQYLDSMEHGMTPDEFDGFQDLRKQYSNAMTLKPLAQKAPLGEGVNPNLVEQRAITEGNAFAPNGQRTDLGELGALGKGPLTNRIPDSGTAQRAMIYTGLAGLAGAGANAALGNGEGEDQMSNTERLLGVPATIAAGALGSRAMGSRLAARYAQARLPEQLGKYVTGAASTLPAGMAAAENNVQPSADQGMADGGQPQPQYQKSSFWDLVKQAWHEATTPSESTPSDAQAAPDPGSVASGSKGADFDRWVNSNVDAQSQ